MMNEIQNVNAGEIEVRPIEVITEEINFFKRTAGSAILEIGIRLNEAKASLNHGEWGEWLKNEIEFSEATAQRFMRLAREYTNPSPVTDLGVSKALILLALPENEREDFAGEKHLVNGEEKTVAEMSKRELETAVKEKNEALEREKEAQQKVLELEAELSHVKSSEARTSALLDDAVNELDELKANPIVSNEPSAEAIEKIKKETETEFADKIEKLKKKIDKLAEEKKKAEQKGEEIQQNIDAIKNNYDKAAERAQTENANLKNHIKELEGKIAVNNSAALTMFKAYFKVAQDDINNLFNCIDGAGEEKEKLKTVLAQLINACKNRLQS